MQYNTASVTTPPSRHALKHGDYLILGQWNPLRLFNWLIFQTGNSYSHQRRFNLMYARYFSRDGKINKTWLTSLRGGRIVWKSPLPHSVPTGINSFQAFSNSLLIERNRKSGYYFWRSLNDQTVLVKQLKFACQAKCLPFADTKKNCWSNTFSLCQAKNVFLTFSQYCITNLAYFCLAFNV